jgi:hypothetical protein
LLISQQLEAVFAQLLGPACAVSGVQGYDEDGNTENTQGEGENLHHYVHR